MLGEKEDEEAEGGEEGGKRTLRQRKQGSNMKGVGDETVVRCMLVYIYVWYHSLDIYKHLRHRCAVYMALMHFILCDDIAYILFRCV